MLNKKDLDKFKEKYENDKNNILRQRMLNKVKLVDLIQDQNTELNYDFNININTHGITDQKSSGRCWIFAALNILREKVIEKCNLDNFEISESYIAYYDKLERFNILLERLINYKNENKNLYDRSVSNLLEKGMIDGGYFTQFADLVNKYGVVPKNVFPESFSSSNTYEINQILSRLLRKFYLELEDEIKKIDDLKNNYMEQAYTIMTNIYGIPPEIFNFEYTDKSGEYHITKNITPKEFYDRYIGIDLKNNYIELSSYQDERIKYNNVYVKKDSSRISESNDYRTLNVSPQDFKSLIIKQIKSLEPVYIYCSTTSKRIDGVWIDLMERYGDTFDFNLKLDNNSVQKTNGLTNTHCMLITGVNIIDEKPIKWKIENSWGNEYGNKGYCVASDNWINNYVYRIVINKKYLSNDQLNILKKNPILIENWDAKF